MRRDSPQELGNILQKSFMATEVRGMKKCRLHPKLEKLIAKYRKGIPMEHGICDVCENQETLKIIAKVATRSVHYD